MHAVPDKGELDPGRPRGPGAATPHPRETPCRAVVPARRGVLDRVVSSRVASRRMLTDAAGRQTPDPTVSKVFSAAAEPESSASISRSSLLSVFDRQTAQATPRM